MNTSIFYKQINSRANKHITSTKDRLAVCPPCSRTPRSAPKRDSYESILLGMGKTIWEKGKLRRIYIDTVEQFIEFAETAELDLDLIYNNMSFANRISHNPTWFDCNTRAFVSQKATVNTLFKMLEID